MAESVIYAQHNPINLRVSRPRQLKVKSRSALGKLYSASFVNSAIKFCLQFMTTFMLRRQAIHAELS